MGNLISGFVFVPPDTTYTERSPHPVTWILTKSRRKIPAYWMPSRHGSTKRTIVYSHGNATDIGGMYEFLELLHANLNVNILCYDYIGYGMAKDQGSPSESFTYESAEAAITALQNDYDIAPHDVIIFGTSVGSGPSCHLAANLGVRGLILECPFLSCVKVVTTNPLGKVVDMFRNENKIGKVECPVLLFHGKKDDIVPFWHGATLFDKVQDKYKFDFVQVDEAGHHDIIECLSVHRYLETIHDFIEHCDRFYEENKGLDIFQKRNLPLAPAFSSSSERTSDPH